MLPTKWPKTPIESLCIRVTSGGTPSRSNPAYYDGGTIPWIKTGELRGWYVDAISERITPAAVKESSAKVFPAETVLLAMYGDGRTMGSVGLTRAPAATNQACCAMLTNPEHCVPKFLMYALMHYKPALLKLAISGAQRNLSGKSIKEFEIGAPPVEVQHRIASILSAYDDLIENNTRRIAILEEMARRLYEEWFVRFRFPGHEGVRMVESELGLVPQGWDVVRLDQVLVLQRGFDLPKQDRIEGRFSIVSSTGSNATHHECRVKGPGVVTGRSGSLGVVMYVEDDFWPLNTTLWVKQFIVGSPLYAFFVLRSIDLAGFNSGSAVPTLNRNDIHGLPVVRPSPELLARFDDVVGPILSLKERLVLKNANLRTTRDLLLPKLISGELDVFTLPEPLAETV